MNVPDQSSHERSWAGYTSSQAARKQPPKRFLYVAALYEGAG
jgi:hypothetical protein